jgi:phytoene synthase
MTAPIADIDAAHAWCRDVTRRKARNFYYGLKLAPEPQRTALYSIYAWMRSADDIADAAGPDQAQRRMHIDAFRAATDAALSGEAGGDSPLWVALAHTASRFEIPGAALHAMLDGQIADLSHRPYRTFADVRDYCYRVASTVGLICISVWGYKDPKARELAIDRGIAFQLTNILRDYREDFDAGRVYLPEEDFGRHSLTPDLLRRWEDPPACRRFILDQVARAQAFYAKSAELERMITGSCRPTLRAMTAIYQALLNKIERFPQRIVMDHRLRVSAVRKGLIAVRAACMRRSDPEPA